MYERCFCVDDDQAFSLSEGLVQPETTMPKNDGRDFRRSRARQCTVDQDSIQ